MREYPKIETLFNRDPKTFKVVEGAWRLPEFEYLASNQWDWTEKIDGTNVRIGWDGTSIRFGGRTDDAQMPTFLLARLQGLVSPETMALAFPDATEVTLYGEGYGAKIQKGGGNYKRDGVDFVLFDVQVGEWWLRRADVESVADKLGIQVVPIVGRGTLLEAVQTVKASLMSKWGEFVAEGLVVRPTVELRTRSGHRLVGKIKDKDFQTTLMAGKEE